VLWQLRREYPDATVNRLPKFLYPEIASVLYSQLADQSSAWLEKLCDCEVVVSHVVTSTQLLSDLFQEYPDPVLLHMVDGENRHRLLLAVDGLPLHMRQAVDTDSLGKINAFTVDFSLCGSGDVPKVDIDDNKFAEKYLCESLKYLSESVFHSLKDVLVVFPRELNNSESLAFPDEYLARHLLGLRSDVSYQHITLCNEGEKKTSPLISLDSFNKGCLSDILINKKSILKFRDAKSLCLMRTVSSYAVTRHSAKFRRILERSIATISSRRHAFILRRCTFIVFLLFIFVLLASSMSGILSIQERANITGELASLKVNLQELKQHAAALHESPFYVMDSINRIHVFEEAAIPAPSQIMSSVAAVVQDFPSVTITGFTWSVVDEESDPAYVRVNSVSIRDTYWDEDTSHSKTMVELSGQLVSESSLRQKQSQLNNFLGILSKSETISDLRVIDSPAKSASSSYLMSEPGGVFKILFSIKKI
jgi:hypothetical protein